MQSLGHILSLIVVVDCRPECSTMVGLMAIAVFVFGNMAVYGQYITTCTIVVVGVFGIFTQKFACALNDIGDMEIDRISHPERPLPSGKVSVREAWLTAIICFVVSLVCGLILAPSTLSCYYLIGHLSFSTLYSFPGIHLARHWFFGPLTLVAAFASHPLFVLSCTPFYHSGSVAQQIIFLIVSTIAIHHLLTIPVKDIDDVKGDAKQGGSSLAMFTPIWTIYGLTIAGYVLPWILLYFRVNLLGSSIGQFAEIITSLRAVAIIFCLIGLIPSYCILFRPKLYFHYRYITINRLIMLYLFQLAQPIVLYIVRSYG